MTTIELTKKEEIFVTCYFATIDFTETGDTDQPPHGADLDDDFIREQTVDCLSFYSRISCYINDDKIEQAAHDFWLSRNGHGTGFWDREEIYGEYLAKMLNDRAVGYGEVDAVFDELHECDIEVIEL